MLKRRRTRSSRSSKTNKQTGGIDVEGEEEEEEEEASSFQEIPFEYEIVNRTMYHPSVFRK